MTKTVGNLRMLQGVRLLQPTERMDLEIYLYIAIVVLVLTIVTVIIAIAYNIHIGTYTDIRDGPS